MNFFDYLRISEFSHVARFSPLFKLSLRNIYVRMILNFTIFFHVAFMSIFITSFTIIQVFFESEFSIFSYFFFGLKSFILSK